MAVLGCLNFFFSAVSTSVINTKEILNFDKYLSKNVYNLWKNLVTKLLLLWTLFLWLGISSDGRMPGFKVFNQLFVCHLGYIKKYRKYFG
jgi:hypothetical protein